MEIRIDLIMDLPDIQSAENGRGFKLTRVGVTKVKKPVVVARPDRRITLVSVIDAFVDLPSRLRGSHLSRNIEAIHEVLDACVRSPVKSLEDLSAEISLQLLDKHDYASTAEVRMEADYFLERHSPSGASCLENYKLMAMARAKRGDNVRKMIGCEVIGMAACPCGMETTKMLAKERHSLSLPGVFLTHNQRNVSRVLIEIPEGFSIEADDLIDIVERAFSSPTHEILKRQDEAEIILKAHENPKFVEDIVRDILHQIVETYSELPDDVNVIVQSESEESIHKHNAFAERRTTLGELRK